MPGYIKNAAKFAQLGIETVGVVTTNDRFVNEEWMAAQGQVGKTSSDSSGAKITMISDGDGDLVKQMGLADDMGFGVGIRSKRFVLVTDADGQVERLFADEGMDDCSATRASNVLQALDPEGAVSAEDEMNPVALLGVVGVIAAAALIGGPMMSGGGSSSPPPSPTKTYTQKVVTPARGKSESSFSLINEYMK